MKHTFTRALPLILALWVLWSPATTVWSAPSTSADVDTTRAENLALSFDVSESDPLVAVISYRCAESTHSVVINVHGITYTPQWFLWIKLADQVNLLSDITTESGQLYDYSLPTRQRTQMYICYGDDEMPTGTLTVTPFLYPPRGTAPEVRVWEYRHGGSSFNGNILDIKANSADWP